MLSRAELRQHMRRQRLVLSSRQRRHYAEQLCSRLIRQRIYRNSRRVALYFSHQGEMDLAPVMHDAWKMKKHIFMPVLDSISTNRLRFAPYEERDPVCLNRFGIVEPGHGPGHFIAASRLDLIVMPLVAFDDGGNRLGMGGGYYDRTLSFLCNRTRWRRPKLIGVGYEFQRVAHLENEPWDVAADMIITEAAVYSPVV